MPISRLGAFALDDFRAGFASFYYLEHLELGVAFGQGHHLGGPAPLELALPAG